MTKSGIGTTSPTPQQLATSMSNLSSSGDRGTGSGAGQTLASASIAQAEIPIWVADKKKWVTGISKKTTINDLIYAILKQCQLVHSATAAQLDHIASQYVLIEYKFDENATTTTNNNNSCTKQQQHQQQHPQIMPFLDSNNQPHHNLVLSSQRILNGDSKVYKYLSSWSHQPLNTTSQITTTTSSTSNNLMLKIFKKEALTNENPNSDLVEQPCSNTNSTSLATKLLKKFGVSSSSTTQNQSNVNNSTQCSTKQPLFKYVDVKLPNNNNNNNNNKNLTVQHQQLQSPNSYTSNNSNNSSSNTSNNVKLGPNTPKNFLFNTIFDKESKLKQQIEKFKLLDEMIKETEKASHNPNNILDQLSFNVEQSTTHATNPLASNANNNLDLNDIYCHFPEMCTHHIKEVEDFTLMCCQLFKLEESIKQQKQVLNSLEYELQRELTQNHNNPNSSLSLTNLLSGNKASLMSSNNNNESPETLELRKEVNVSREQTRLQCKQLHDLDLKMRQNEQSLMLKEQQLQQLLEELYIQEIYSDNVNTFASSSALNTSGQPYQLDEQVDEQQQQQHSMIRINDGSCLSSHQKSLSFGNLNALAAASAAVEKSGGGGQSKSLANKMKTSPSLEINTMGAASSSSSSSSSSASSSSSSQSSTTSSSKDETATTKTLLTKSVAANGSASNNNSSNNNNNKLNPSPNDHQTGGDNDSGISSMSSETTPTIQLPIVTQTSVNSNNITTANGVNATVNNMNGNNQSSSTASTSSTASSSNFSNGLTQVVIQQSYQQQQHQQQAKYFNNFSNHANHHHHQRAFQYQPTNQMNTNQAINNKQTKSVLETLV